MADTPGKDCRRPRTAARVPRECQQVPRPLPAQVPQPEPQAHISAPAAAGTAIRSPSFAT